MMVMSYFRVNNNCNGCLACVENCPASALRYEDNASTRTISHNMTRCARCGQCWRVCPEDAIEFATASLMKKILHKPSVALRKAGEAEDQQIIDAARKLFGLDKD